MSSKRGNPAWIKGKSGNPKGKQSTILPEIQRSIDSAKNEFKYISLKKLDGKVEEWIEQIIDSGIAHGDIFKLKMLLEMTLGKMVEEEKEFPLSDEEKELVLEWRRRKLAISGDVPK